LEKEGVTQVFGVPGAAINPFYAALRSRAAIGHILARHVEGASHMAEGYTRAKCRQHRRVHRHFRPGRHRHDHRPVFGGADSIPILCITGQAPRARLYKEDFQASISSRSPSR
jgi:tartronate-semialdehyde synthase